MPTAILRNGTFELNGETRPLTDNTPVLVTDAKLHVTGRTGWGRTYDLKEPYIILESSYESFGSHITDVSVYHQVKIMPLDDGGHSLEFSKLDRLYYKFVDREGDESVYHWVSAIDLEETGTSFRDQINVARGSNPMPVLKGLL